MSKLNTKQVVKAVYHNVKLGKSENNNIQYVKDASSKLFEFIVSSFYAKDSARQAELGILIKSAVAHGEAQLVANIIKFAKVDMGMRTMPIAAAVLLAKYCREFGVKDVSIRSLVHDTIVRADELCDMYSYALAVFGTKNAIPLAVKRGVEDAFSKFSEYDLAKYNREGGVTLANLLRIVHPTPAIEQMGRVYKQILEGTLASPYTWEVEFSKNGQLHASEQKPKSVIWRELLEANSLGFLAAIRNVRNMAEAQIDSVSQRLLGALISKGNKRVLPFQIYQAYKMVPRTMGGIKNALADAMEKSVSNVPVIGERVWMVVDASGSMQDKLPQSEVTFLATAAQLAAVAVKSQLLSGKQVAVTVFGTKAVTLQFTGHTSVVGIAEQLEEMKGTVGGSTDLNTALREYPKVVRAIGKPDTFMVFSDMQVNDRGMFGYQSYNAVTDLPKQVMDIPLKVAVNFKSKDTTPLAKHLGFVQLTGYSEKIFQLLQYLRNYDRIFTKLRAV